LEFRKYVILKITAMNSILWNHTIFFHFSSIIPE
jgi:hypothetical protein